MNEIEFQAQLKADGYTERKSMKVALKRTAIATSTVACVVLLSFNWSEQRGVSLGVESAQARIDRPLTPSSVAGAARRQHRRSGNGLFREVVAATTSLWNYDDYYCYGVPYAGRGYPPGSYYYSSYPGDCVSRSDITGLIGRPTLFPRYYGGRDW
jgi:hypothetical protein